MTAASVARAFTDAYDDPYAADRDEATAWKVPTEDPAPAPARQESAAASEQGAASMEPQTGTPDAAGRAREEWLESIWTAP
jgi:hypothetical protein